MSASARAFYGIEDLSGIDFEAIASLTDEEIADLDDEMRAAILSVREMLAEPAMVAPAPQPISADPSREKVQLRVKVRKVSPDKRLVFGWLSVSTDKDGNLVVDHEGHTIDPADLEEAVYAFVLDSRKMGELHEAISGRLVESVIFTQEKLEKMGIPPGLVPLGWWVGFYVESDAAWEKIKSGEYRAFSIGGSATPGD
jgi:hypothetical protein